jgi:hypothetical protein
MAWQHPDGRLIYCLRYNLAAVTSTELIVWLTPEGHATVPGVVAESGRPIVFTKPGEWILLHGKRVKVVALEPYRHSGMP